MFRELLNDTIARQRAGRARPVLEQGYLQKWLRRGKIQPVASETARELHSFLITLPRSGQGLDSTRIPCSRTRLLRPQPSALDVDWFLSTPLGRSPLVLLFFSPDEPCLACEPKFAIEHIREFEFQGSFRRQLFGARRVQNRVEVFTERFGEFDGDHMLWAAI